MPERPLLILPTPGEPAKRRNKPSGFGKFKKPSRRRQHQRIQPLFRQLQEAFVARRAALRTDAQGVIPEDVVVLETVGTVEGFIRAVDRIEGMEWLAEIEEEEIPPDDDFFAMDKRDGRIEDKPLRGRLFMLFTNQTALEQMLTLWRQWQRGRTLPRGLGRWKTLFEQLKDVRRWNAHDRLFETGVLDDWRERAEHGQEVVPAEIELWYRSNAEARRNARTRVSELVSALEGQIVGEAVIDDISYHALLATLPVEAVRDLFYQIESDAELVQCEQIQFFRASGQMSVLVSDNQQQADAGVSAAAPPSGEPVLALLDGLPLQGHQRLVDRLILDDPDDYETDYPAEDRRHGTGMASLILWGDINAGDTPLAKPLYVRPLLRPDARDWRSPREESVPENVLVVDLIHRAVRRVFEGDGNQPPAAPSIRVINLSIGIRDRLFDGVLSPLARLLDWLSWRYKVLFVVSAGNHANEITLTVPRGSVPGLPPHELRQHVVGAVAADARNRRLLSPSESVNSLTVGAVHADDHTGALPPAWLDPFQGERLPSVISAQGMGYRRSIKPDVLAPGGRVCVQETPRTTPTATLSVFRQTHAPGQCVAAPGTTSGDVSATWHTRGTSNATALVSRGAAILDDTLDQLERDPGGDLIATVPRAVWLKALLAHGADWGAAGRTLDELLRTSENSRQFKEYVTRLLGYGELSIDRVRECTELRATAVGGGDLEKDQSHVHQIPLPPSLSGERGHRRLVTTLAWLTPVNPRHQAWRRADLWFSPPKDPLRVDRQQADWRAVQRGTLQHEILDGDRAAAYVDGTNLEIQVSCRADGGDFDDPIPYALITTIEVAEDIGVEIYDEIQVRVHQRVRVSPPAS